MFRILGFWVWGFRGSGFGLWVWGSGLWEDYPLSGSCSYAGICKVETCSKYRMAHLGRLEVSNINKPKP